MQFEFQHRYHHYCREHNRSSAEMQEIDGRRYLYGAMSGYILWLSNKWKEWQSLSKPSSINRRYATVADHANFNSWLANKQNYQLRLKVKLRNISPDEMHRGMRTVQIGPMTSNTRRYPWRIYTAFQGKKGAVALDQIRSIDRQRI